MLGILDSGEGGRLTLAMLRRFYKREDVILLADRERAPYGLLSRGELIRTVEDRAELLLSLGVRRIIVGCCTASTVCPYLDSAVLSSVIPIIAPTARRAISVSESGRIALLATRATVESCAFGEYIDSVEGVDAQTLVGMVESGERDGCVSFGCALEIERLLSGLKSRADTLILGCTHFPALEATVGALGRKYGIKSTVSSVREGVLHALSLLGEEKYEGGVSRELTTPLKK